jgi:hypothetical protein
MFRVEKQQFSVPSSSRRRRRHDDRGATGRKELKGKRLDRQHSVIGAHCLCCDTSGCSFVRGGNEKMICFNLYVTSPPYFGHVNYLSLPREYERKKTEENTCVKKCQLPLWQHVSTPIRSPMCECPRSAEVDPIVLWILLRLPDCVVEQDRITIIFQKRYT